KADKNFRLSTPSEAAARDSVRRGKIAVAVIIPKNFGEASGQAFFSVGSKPTLQFLYDPSRRTELAMVSGIFTQHVMQAVSREMFGGAQGRALVDQTLPQVESLAMDRRQRAALANMLR